jgi:hypothetical protein
MKLPEAVTLYFEADRQAGPEALAAALAPDAVVEDEGATHVGTEAIQAWWLAAKQKYQHVAEPFESSQAGDTVHVRARVTGHFPSSPAMLQYVFTLRGDTIVKLRISA